MLAQRSVICPLAQVTRMLRSSETQAEGPRQNGERNPSPKNLKYTSVKLLPKYRASGQRRPKRQTKAATQSRFIQPRRSYQTVRKTEQGFSSDCNQPLYQIVFVLLHLEANRANTSSSALRS